MDQLVLQHPASAEEGTRQRLSPQTQFGSPPKFQYGAENWAAPRRAADIEYSLSKVAEAGV